MSSVLPHFGFVLFLWFFRSIGFGFFGQGGAFAIVIIIVIIKFHGIKYFKLNFHVNIHVKLMLLKKVAFLIVVIGSFVRPLSIFLLIALLSKVAPL